MAHDVFISHSSKDKICADALCATLEKHNVRCWVAPRDILPVSDYGSAIVEGIKASKVMILIFSSNSNESAHVKREVERAVNHGIIIVPFKIEDVALSSTMEYFVSGTHWLDAIDPPFENHLKSVTEHICLLLNKPIPIWEQATNTESVVITSEIPSSSQDEFVAVYLKGNKVKEGSLLKSYNGIKNKLKLIFNIFFVCLFFGVSFFLVPLDKYFNEHDQSKIVHAMELFQTKDYNNAIKEFNLI